MTKLNKICCDKVADVALLFNRRPTRLFRWLWLKLQGKHVITGKDLDRFIEVLKTTSPGKHTVLQIGHHFINPELQEQIDALPKLEHGIIEKYILERKTLKMLKEEQE